MSDSRSVEAPLVLLTGAQGKVGAALLPRLVEAGCRVRAITSREHHERSSPGVEWRTRDFRNGPADAEDVVGCAAVVHLAAEQRDEAAMEAVNVAATRALAAAAEARGVRTFCFTSSVSVYGSPDRAAADESAPLLAADEDDPSAYWVHPALRAYGRSKVRAERALAEVAQQVRYVVLRPTAIMASADLREPLTMGTAKRLIAWHQRTQGIALVDVVDALLWAVRRGLSDAIGPGGIETFNLSDENPPLTYGDVFTAAGAPDVRVGGHRVPPVPGPIWHAAVWARSPGRVLRYPLGYASYPAHRIVAAGWWPPTGIQRFTRAALAPPSVDPPQAVDAATTAAQSGWTRERRAKTSRL